RRRAEPGAAAARGGRRTKPPDRPPAGRPARRVTPPLPRGRRTAAARRPWPPRRRHLRTARTSDHRTGPVRRPAASYRREPAQQVVAQSSGAAVRHVARPHSRPEAECLLEWGTPDERGHEGGTEDVAAARGIAVRVGRHIGRDPGAPPPS